jgi:hypothetical protein
MGNITKTLLARNASCDEITGLLDQSGYYYTVGHLSIYNSDATRLTWHTLSSTAFGASVDGTATAYPISDSTVIQDETATTFAFENRDGSAVWNGLVTTVGHGGALQLDTVNLVQDTTIGISTAQYIVPA